MPAWKSLYCSGGSSSEPSAKTTSGSLLPSSAAAPPSNGTSGSESGSIQRCATPLSVRNCRSSAAPGEERRAMTEGAGAPAGPAALADRVHQACPRLPGNGQSRARAVHIDPQVTSDLVARAFVLLREPPAGKPVVLEERAGDNRRLSSAIVELGAPRGRSSWPARLAAEEVTDDGHP